MWVQRQIFIYGALGYFKLEALVEGLRRLMSYKLALLVLVTFTEQVVSIQKHITLLWIPIDIRNKNSHNETNEKSSGEVIWPHSNCIFIEYLHWPRVIRKMAPGHLFHTLYITITNSQHQKKRMLIVIHFNPSHSFFYYRDLLSAA